MAQDNSSPLSSPLHLLHRAAWWADELFARNLGGVDVTPRQLIVLQAVFESDGLNQTSIMAATGIDRSSIADLVRRLVIKGWLRRRRTRRDARQYGVRITPQGRHILTLGQPAVRATDDTLLSAIPNQQQALFLRWLVQLAAQH
jgi:DNA-binding MarR family transcriptional regulator